jgi:hypothetical protein
MYLNLHCDSLDRTTCIYSNTEKQFFTKFLEIWVHHISELLFLSLITAEIDVMVVRTSLDNNVAFNVNQGR